jgi:toxin ParE1/3/4
MAKIVWTTESLRWLKEIDDHIAKDSDEAAARVVEGIYEKVQLLNDHPRAGFRYLQVKDREVRVLLYGHYRVFYEVVEEERVTILGIFHAALDVRRYLS